MPSPTPIDPDTAGAPVPVLAIIALSLAALANGVALRITDALLPRLATEFSITLGEASQVVTMFAIAYGFAQLLFGPLGDRFGKYRVIAWACAASALTSMLCGLAPGYGGLLVARLLAGATAAAVIPLAMAWIGDVVPYEQRQPVLARFLIGQISGFALGIWAGGFAADHLDWRTPFLVLGAFFLLMALVLGHVQRRLPASALRRAPRDGSRRSSTIDEFRAVLASRWGRIVLLAVFLEGGSLYGVLPFVAAHLHERFSLSLSNSGALVMVFAAGGIVYAFGAKRLVQNLSEPAMIRSGAILMATSLALTAFAQAWWWVLPACIVMGFGYYMMHNTLQVQATQMAPERRGAAVAAFAGSFFLGQSAGVALAGLRVESVGTAGILVTGAVAVAFCAWNFNRQRRPLLAAAPLPPST
ncbi:MAG: MFS transporter [Burkholderiaceae bacterium]|nr:MFS transporter [Burkholderiaceae bacterium]